MNLELTFDREDPKWMEREKSLYQRLQDNRDKILALATRYGACNIRLFGSVVRGEAGDEVLLVASYIR